ncbi:MAG: glycosyltransferase family 2 protein [Paludibacteraceae bacterium]|nr:glycosyltransferase family 2 protein [Paludibacteraceae bacterium]
MISIVIPLYNKAQSITHTLDSVLAQTYTDYEVIVVNDGSTDGSDKVVEDYIKSPITNHKSQIHLVSQPNGGVCSARNRGIREAKGEYVALLDADDQWDKEYLAEQVRMIEDFPDAAMWGINFAELSNGQLIRKLATGLPEVYRGYVDHYFEMPGRVSDLFCSSSVVIRKEVFDKVDYFDERIKYAEDTDMWFRIIATHAVAFYDRYMVYYQFDAENRTQKRERRLKDFLPYYVDKYKDPLFQSNAIFYQWIMRWAANHIKRFYFGKDSSQWEDAKQAIRKLDYQVIPPKYRLLYKTPRVVGNVLFQLDQLRMK